MSQCVRSYLLLCKRNATTHVTTTAFVVHYPSLQSQSGRDDSRANLHPSARVRRHAQ
jgi:hypothetical protein